MALQVGDRAPEIKSGAFQLSKLKGKRVVLFFYPKSDTPGCTKEACEFRDLSKKFDKAETMIVGLSPDKPEAQEKFATKYGLPYAFAADPDHKIAEAYGVWKEKSMYGKKYMGVERSTFLIDAKGVLRQEWRKVKVPGHSAEVLAAVKGL